MNEKKYLQLVYLIINISLLLRIIIPFYFFGNWVTIDSKNYILHANALLNGGFGLYFPNGFPALIALVTSIVGKENTVITMIILNVILSTASVYLFWLICKNYFGPGIYSLIAVALFAFYPNQLNFVRFVLTEVPALFFVMLSFYFISKESFPSAALSIGIAATIKTTLLVVIIFFSIYQFYKKSYVGGIKYILLASVPVLAMAFYGLIITGVFTIGYNSIHNFYITVDQSGLKSTNAIDAAAYYLNYAISHPIQFISERLNSLWEFWGFLPSSNVGLREYLIFRLLIGIRFPLILLAIYGFLIKDKNNLIIFSAVTIFSLTLLHIIFFSIPRYNFITEPFLIFLAVAGLSEIVINMRKKKIFFRMNE